LTVWVLYLTQPIIVGEDYASLALFIDDLLSGDTLRQFLRESGRDRAADQDDKR
jgi:hypothetical protein